MKAASTGQAERPEQIPPARPPRDPAPSSHFWPPPRETLGSVVEARPPPQSVTGSRLTRQPDPVATHRTVLPRMHEAPPLASPARGSWASHHNPPTVRRAGSGYHLLVHPQLALVGVMESNKHNRIKHSNVCNWVAFSTFALWGHLAPKHLGHPEGNPAS